jgi:ribonuclease HII
METHKKLIGVDEVGRGCLAGNVISAAVFIPNDIPSEAFRDSKKLSKKMREELYVIISRDCLWGIGSVGPEKIDEINIANATYLSMKLAISDLFSRNKNLLKSDFKLMIDGDRFTGYPGMEHECIIKGDDKFKCISAASIIAKVSRDLEMKVLGESFPGYLWGKNVGYGTKEHSDAINRLGLNKHHRKSFCSKFI